jgi:hypothetical protein
MIAAERAFSSQHSAFSQENILEIRRKGLERKNICSYERDGRKLLCAGQMAKN